MADPQGYRSDEDEDFLAAAPDVNPRPIGARPRRAAFLKAQIGIRRELEMIEAQKNAMARSPESEKVKNTAVESDSKS